MKHRVRQGALGAIALSLIAAGSTASASAEVKVKRSAAAVVAAAAAHRIESDFFAGYITNESTVTSANATFKVPKLNCGNDRRSYFITLEGSAPSAGADVRLTCDGGKPSYSLEAFALDGENVILEQADVKPGATVKVSLTQKNGKITAKANNLSVTTDALPETSVIYGLIDAEGTPPPDFGKVTYTGVRLNGKTLSAKKATKFDLVKDDVTVKTSKLKKGKFTLTFKE